MPRAMSDYSLLEWARLRPLMQALKTARYRAVDKAYRSRPAVIGDVAAIAREIAGRNVLVTVAFADVNAARWQIALVRHYVPGVVHVLVDNSPTDEVAVRICRVAEAEGARYLRLPRNPWTGKSPSRSHGLALNWTWHNLIRPAAPHAFGFIDDDLFPTAHDDPFAPLAEQDVYGQVRRIGERWFLWAGFCMFRFDKVAALPLDFGQDWFIGLDTGGGNWEPLYSRIDLAALREAETRFVPFRDDLAVADGPLQWVGTWLHEVGLMGRPELFDEKRGTVEALIAPHLAAAMRPFIEKETASSP
ncbi:MAG: hypothetical protein HZA68_22930 [Rhodovulum sp.]|nr:hypothetical protein [Rhodovulum sp.]